MIPGLCDINRLFKSTLENPEGNLTLHSKVQQSKSKCLTNDLKSHKHLCAIMSISEASWKGFQAGGSTKHLGCSCFFISVHKPILTWHQNFSWGKARSQLRSSEMNFARSRNSSTKAGSLVAGGGLYSTKDRSALISGCCRKPKHCLKTREQGRGTPRYHVLCSLTARKPKLTLTHLTFRSLVTSHSVSSQGSRAVALHLYLSVSSSGLQNVVDVVPCSLLTRRLAKQSSHTSQTATASCHASETWPAPSFSLPTGSCTRSHGATPL